jgi:hypothetical protein
MPKRTPAAAPAEPSIRRAINRQTKLIRTRGARWSQAAEARFLETLAASANVTAAAQAAGFSTTAIYKRRLNDARFAARWAEAMEVGYTRLECLAIEAGAAALAGTPLDAGGPLPRMTAADVLNLLRLHRAAVKGGPAQRYAWRAQEPDIEEVRAEVLRRVAVLGREREA